MKASLNRMSASLFVLSTFLFCLNARADALVLNAPITQITSTAHNQVSFGIYIGGGTGPCATVGQFIAIYPAQFPSVEEYKRAFAIALTAYLTGKRIDLHSYVAGDVGCNNTQVVIMHD